MAALLRYILLQSQSNSILLHVEGIIDSQSTSTVPYNKDFVIHAVWVIRNGYKKLFCKLVRFIKKIRNEN